MKQAIATKAELEEIEKHMIGYNLINHDFEMRAGTCQFWEYHCADVWHYSTNLNTAYLRWLQEKNKWTRKLWERELFFRLQNMNWYVMNHVMKSRFYDLDFDSKLELVNDNASKCFEYIFRNPIKYAYNNWFGYIKRQLSTNLWNFMDARISSPTINESDFSAKSEDNSFQDFLSTFGDIAPRPDEATNFDQVMRLLSREINSIDFMSKSETTNTVLKRLVTCMLYNPSVSTLNYMGLSPIYRSLVIRHALRIRKLLKEIYEQ